MITNLGIYNLKGTSSSF